MSLGRQLCIAIMATSLTYPFHSIGQSSNLPKQAQLDLIEFRVYENLKNKNLEQALAEIAKYREIEVLPPVLAFLEAKIAWANGDAERTVAVLEEYFNVLGDGKTDENYNEALRMYEEALSEREAARNACELSPTPHCIFVEALSVAQNVDDEERASETYAKIAIEQARAGYHQEARETFHLASQQSSSYLVFIGTSQAKAGYDREARETFNHAIKAAATKQDKRDTARILMSVAYSQAEAGYDRDVRDTFNLAVEAAASSSNSIYYLGRVAQSQKEAGYDREARVTFDRAIQIAYNMEPTNYKYLRCTALLNIADDLVATGFDQKAKQVFALAVECALKITDQEPHHATGTIPNLIEVASSFAKHGYHNEAEDVFNLATELGRNVGDTKKLARLSIPPSIVDGFQNAASVDFYFFGRSFESGRGYIRCGGTARVAFTQFNAGHYPSTEQAIDVAMIACKNEYDMGDIIPLMGRQAAYQAQSGHISKAIKIARKIKRARVKKNITRYIKNQQVEINRAFLAIAEAQMEAGDEEAANKTMSEISPNSNLAGFQIKIGDYQAAQNTLADALLIFAKEEYFRNTLLFDFFDTSLRLARKQAETGNPHAAIQTLDITMDAIDRYISLRADPDNVDNYYRRINDKMAEVEVDIIKLQAERGDYDTANRMLTQAITRARNFRQYPLTDLITQQVMTAKVQGEYQVAERNLNTIMEYLLNYEKGSNYQEYYYQESQYLERSLSHVLSTQLSIAKIQSYVVNDAIPQALAAAFEATRRIEDARIRASLLAKLARYLQGGTWELSEI